MRKEKLFLIAGTVLFIGCVVVLTLVGSGCVGAAACVYAFIVGYAI